ncbi:uncharacterized protein with ParB-like and HNH nuclease domain [Maritalea mobilis]|uniref:Uncharacterized protein with ParB-like and HNH nuclease domain n=1 Tax=Maritalea mobilis TaxID=483324 RepID=A0A4V3DBN4_9HYPH|nr:DUF262 domain-containing protein [Maritalea mobilis]TDQ67258.1 uncharacterized protein with ParB-like and HNH nuclease domain [Maritalea mobilis]
MKANETRIDKFMASNETTFAIPVYQRNYDWTKVQCQQLFRDLLEIGRNDAQGAHFIGSIVYVHDDVYAASGLTELTVIDGQQRLTTLTLLYVAIYRFALAEGNDALAQRIFKTYLINEFSSETEKLKLKPTDNNRLALAQILDPNESTKVSGFSRLVENFRLFQGLVTSENLDVVQRGLTKLIFVDIALDRQKDNPQRIFESLNSTGLELSQADLIRNYILMGLPRAAQEKLFRSHWEPIEANAKNQTTNESKVSEFIRDYLTMKTKVIPNKSAVYDKFKDRFPEPNSEGLKSALDELRTLSEVYNKLLNPSQELDEDIKSALMHINALEINVAYPFLMKVYQDFVEGVIEKTTFIAVLELTQAFVWRRFVMGLPTNALNKIFMTLYDRVNSEEYLSSIERAIMQKTGSQRFPRDAEVVSSLKDKDMYNTKAKTRAYFFDRIENHKNKEHVDVSSSDITIEHIFPQNPDAIWRRSLDSEEYSALAEKYLNTVGNLTLSGNNGKLGNKSFEAKRDMNIDGGEEGYRFSRLWLNRDLKNCTSWDVSKVEERAEAISSRFLEIWPEPIVDLNADDVLEEVNIFDAEEPKFKKLEYAVFFGSKLILSQVAKLYVEVFRQLIDLQPDAFYGTNLGERIQLTDDNTVLRQALQISDRYFVEGNIDNTIKFDRIKLALSELGIEDELSIKYL